MFYKCIGIIRNKLNTGCQVKIKDVGFVQPCGENKSNPYFTSILREDTHKKSFFCGRTNKGEGPTPTTKQNSLFFYKPGFFSPKIGEEKSCQNPFQAIIYKKKVAWTTKPLV